MLLRQEMDKQLIAGENVLVSLPGSFGEALAVTDRRAFVIRECEGGVAQGCNVHSYLLGIIKSAEAFSTGTGGYIELSVSEPVSDPEATRVYFPSYDLAKFQSAAAYISELVASVSSPVAQAAAPVGQAVAAPSGGVACPKCGAAVGSDSTFCGGCGVQLRLRCATCGSSSPAGVKFCDACGSAFKEAPAGCPKCGALIQRWQSYCTECGSILQQTCAACGGNVREEWKYCSHCGRQLGTGYINPRTSAARRIQERLNTLDTTATAGSVFGGSTPIIEAPEEEETPAATPQAPAPANAGSGAEYHNQLGREYFDKDDIEGAIREFRAAIAADPNNPSYHCNLAVALDEDDQDEEALNEYETTLSLDPKDLTALLSLGYMYNEGEEQAKATEVWNKLLEIAPDSAEAQEVRENLRQQGNL